MPQLRRRAQRTVLRGMRPAGGASTSDDEGADRRRVRRARGLGRKVREDASTALGTSRRADPRRDRRPAEQLRQVGSTLPPCAASWDFLVQAGAPLPDVDASFDVGFGVGIGEAPTPGEGAFAKAITRGRASLTPDENSLVEREIESQPWLFRRMFRTMADDYDGLSRRASEAMPRVLFILIPALAAVLALFYRGRHYPEHLYFALHVGAFVFIVLTLRHWRWTRARWSWSARRNHRCARHRRLRRRGAASCLWRLVAGDGSEGARRERDLRSAVVVSGTGSHVMGAGSR